jgi:hypothetical protein
MDINRKIPDYLVEKENIVRSIFLTAAFALIFINIYSPFNVQYWYKISDSELLFYSSLIILTGVLVVVISRIIMYRQYKHGKRLSFFNYGLWILAEIGSMALFYASYELIILHDPRPFPDIFFVALRNTSLVLLLPYSVIWLYLSWKDKKLKLETLSETNSLRRETNVMIPFRDERGILRLSIKKNDFLYCRGNDNYVTIFYNDRNKLSKLLIRNTLKNISSNLHRYPIVRSHRSYIINFEKVKLIEKTKGGMVIKLDTEYPVDVPVSKTYMEEVFRKFSRL